MRDAEIMRRIVQADRAAGHPLPVAARDFADTDDPARIRRALARLSAQGALEEVVSGVWRRPDAARPRPREVAEAIARRMRWRLAIARPVAANAVGLSPQVPAVAMFAVDQPLLAERTYSWDGGRCVFEPAPAWVFALETSAGRCLAQALRSHARDGVPTVDPGRLARTVTRSARPAFLAELAHDADTFPEAYRRYVTAVLQGERAYA